jgi:hypothetical protein
MDAFRPEEIAEEVSNPLFIIDDQNRPLKP